MRKFVLRALGAVALCLAAGVFVLAWFFGEPRAFVDVPIAPATQARLRTLALEGAGPREMALHYYCYPPDCPDGPDPAKLEVRVSNPSADQSVVTIINRFTYSDSTTVTCDRFTMRHEGNLWLPVRHQTAWQGRGRFGWTTQPTL
ncbi:MAG: hypothetical protein JWO94_1355 [Verrucomicrobiaceae bacterium]|nr:hypothetical protein [Verrucomicrobiaceae bacterium]